MAEDGATRISRRDFLKVAGAAAAGAVANQLTRRPGEAMAAGPDGKESDKNTYVSTYSPVPEGSTPEEAKTKLDRYLGSIKNIMDQQKEALIGGLEIFDSSGISQEQLMNIFDTYFPIYYAAQQKYEVPWEMMMIIHCEESDFSTIEEPLSKNRYVGAMQRDATMDSDIHSSESVIDALAGYEFLGLQDYRYKVKSEGMHMIPGNGADLEKYCPSDDLGEIMWAAKFLRYQVNVVLPWMKESKNPKIANAYKKYENILKRKKISTNPEYLDLSEDQQNLVMALAFRYSAKDEGIKRVKKFLKMKEDEEEMEGKNK